MNFARIVLLSLLGASLIFLGGCDNKGCTDPYAINYDMDAQKDDGECTIPNLSLRFNQKVNGEDLVINDVYTVNGYDVKFTLSQFYVSGITFNSGANEYAAEQNGEPVYLLVKSQESMYDVGPVRAGQIQSLNFDVGVDSTTNNQNEIDFASWPADHPLSLQTPAMHWSWLTGYIFLKIEGRIDFNQDGVFDGDDEDLVYHIGLDKYLAEVNLMPNIDIDEATEVIDINYDLAAALAGIDMGIKGNLLTHTMGNEPLAEAVANNLPSAFTIAQ